MALSERERGASREWFALTTTSQRVSFEGAARLIYPDRRVLMVKAELSLRRSFLSVWGEGCFRCDERHGFDALNSEEWLSLLFGGTTPVMIEVVDLKLQEGQCRCLFEVKS